VRSDPELAHYRMLSGAELGHPTHSSVPEGFTENSRWLRSAATTPPVRPQFQTPSEGVPERRFQAAATKVKTSATLQGRTHVGTLSGGVVAPLLNHRLFSVIPPGYQKTKKSATSKRARRTCTRQTLPKLPRSHKVTIEKRPRTRSAHTGLKNGTTQ